ncbi:hypothetical protein PSE_4422 [Pseudovibrio sp. FO-BEG1]|nr:hypothetical protein PSE_4422 [Pseudovibrio sp. FO-BEG1]
MFNIYPRCETDEEINFSTIAHTAQLSSFLSSAMSNL